MSQYLHGKKGISSNTYFMNGNFGMVTALMIVARNSELFCRLLANS